MEARLPRARIGCPSVCVLGILLNWVSGFDSACDGGTQLHNRKAEISLYVSLEPTTYRFSEHELQ